MTPRHLAGLILALILIPTAARAQVDSRPGAPGWSRLSGLAVGKKIVVTLKTGETRTGEVRRVTADGVTIAVRAKTGPAQAREETVPASQISMVLTAGDSIWNGALIGAGVGMGLATWDYYIDPSEPGNAAIFAVAIGLGTAIGAGIDALINRRGTLLYRSPRETAAVAVSPILGTDRQGVLVAVRFYDLPCAH